MNCISKTIAVPTDKSRELIKLKRIDTKNPAIIAKPPSLAIGCLCILLSSFGMSTAPILKARLLTIGVNENATIKARVKEIKYSNILDIHTPSVLEETNMFFSLFSKHQNRGRCLNSLWL